MYLPVDRTEKEKNRIPFLRKNGQMTSPDITAAKQLQKIYYITGMHNFEQKLFRLPVARQIQMFGRYEKC